MKKISRTVSFLIIIGIYALAIYVGYLTHKLFIGQGLLISLFWADVAATVLVWLAGVVMKNSSVYDPYWSVAPIVIVGYWLFQKGEPLAIWDILVVVAVLFWGIRLTVNWAVNWRGMSHEDWRYTKLRGNNKKIWQIINLGGINMMPTVLVYLGLVPVYYMIFEGSAHSWIMYVGFVISIVSPIIQLVADKQMKDHRAKNTGVNIDTGLWRYSRHPNYFGEISFWWGLFIMQLGVAPNIYVSILGAVLITLLFVFVSIPMMEKHVVGKANGFEEYKKRVSMVVPWFRR